MPGTFVSVPETWEITPATWGTGATAPVSEPAPALPSEDIGPPAAPTTAPEDPAPVPAPAPLPEAPAPSPEPPVEPEPTPEPAPPLAPLPELLPPEDAPPPTDEAPPEQTEPSPAAPEPEPILSEPEPIPEPAPEPEPVPEPAPDPIPPLVPLPELIPSDDPAPTDVAPPAPEEPSPAAPEPEPVLAEPPGPEPLPTEPEPVLPPDPAPDPVPQEPEPSPQPEPAPDPAPTRPSPLVDGGFEDGLRNWNTNGAGDVIPTLVHDIVREGSTSARMVLTGDQNRSELTFGGTGTGGTIQLYEGKERFYGFSFNIRELTYGRPGAHNLIMQLKSDGEGSPNFGLQLWDYQGRRGLWSHGDAMGGDRFLQAVDHRQWHDVVIHLRASGQGAGFYELYLNGQLIDSRDGVNTMLPGHSFVYIKNGLYRNGWAIPGTSDIRIDGARLGSTLAEASIR